MLDDNESISLDAEDEVLPSPEENETEQPQDDTEGTQDEQAEGEEEEGDGDLEEYEFEGKKAKIPKEWRDALMKNADYTQKTQAVAEERKAVEAAREAAIRSAEFWEKTPAELVNLKGQLSTIDSHLEQWKKVDFGALAREQGEDVASAEYRRYQMIKDQRADMAQQLDAKGREVEAKQSEETEHRLRETAKHAQTLKGWSPEIDKQIADYIDKKGISRDTWLRNASPQLYEILFDAFTGHKTRQTVTKTQAKPPPAPAQPVPPSQNRAAAPKFNPAKAGMDDYIANFQRRIKAKQK
jgi:hypothetical protein